MTRHEVPQVGQVLDAVGGAGRHLDDHRLIAADEILVHGERPAVGIEADAGKRIDASPETTRKRSHLEWCQWFPLVTPGFETLTETWPRSGVRRNAVKEPRSSRLAFSG